MIKTLLISDVERHAANIYESIIVVAKRARQINIAQKEAVMREREELEDDYQGYEDEEEAVFEGGDFIKLPKPASVALEEFLDGKIKYYYRSPAEEKEEESGK